MYCKYLERISVLTLAAISALEPVPMCCVFCVSTLLHFLCLKTWQGTLAFIKLVKITSSKVWGFLILFIFVDFQQHL